VINQGKECGSCDRNKQLYSVAESVVMMVKKEALGELEQDLKMEIIATGSYISELKVLKPDEFDFLLVLVKERKEQSPLILEAFTKFNAWFKEKQMKLLSFDPASLNPQLIAIYQHGPAWCQRFRWISYGVHNMSIDVTLAVRKQGKAIQKFCKSLKSHTVLGSVYEELNEDVLYVNLDPKETGHTTTTIDVKVFAKLNQVMPKVLLAIRFIKTLISLLFPKELKHCTSSSDGFTESSFISSHIVKEKALKVMDKNTDCHQWENSELKARVMEILGLLKDHVTPGGYIKADTMDLELQMFDIVSHFLEDTSGASNVQEAQILDCFSIIKQRKYAMIGDKMTLIHILRSEDPGRTLLGYIIEEHPLLGRRSRREPYTDLLAPLTAALSEKLSMARILELTDETSRQLDFRRIVDSSSSDYDVFHYGLCAILSI